MIKLNVPDMACGGCARSVTKAVQSIDPTARVEANPEARELRLDTMAREEEILAILEKAGFPARRAA